MIRAKTERPAGSKVPAFSRPESTAPRCAAAGAALAGLRIRQASPDDIPVLEHLVGQAVLGLQSRDYGEQQLASALQNRLLAVDPQLISDGTYYVAELEDRIVGSGGWGRRRAIINNAKDPAIHTDDWLDPATDAAKIRAFYVHPDCARLGIGSQLLQTCEEAAQRAGYQRLELISTLTGAPFYTARGWHSHECLEIPLPDGQVYPAIQMTKRVGHLPGQASAA